MVPPTGVSSFPLIIRWGMEKFAGSRQGAGLHRTLCLDQVPSLWQEREAVCEDKVNPSAHLKSGREMQEHEEKEKIGDRDLEKLESNNRSVYPYVIWFGKVKLSPCT